VPFKKIFGVNVLWHRIFAISLLKQAIMEIRNNNMNERERQDDLNRPGYADTDAAALHPVSNPGDEEGDEDYDDEEDSDGLIGDDVDAGETEEVDLDDTELDDEDFDDEDLDLDDDEDDEDDTL
jgi:hypothetical protein